MTLTEEQKKAYIEGGGVSCPFCGDSDIVGRSVEIDAGQATQEVNCQACDREWTDQYVLDDVIPTERVA